MAWAELLLAFLIFFISHSLPSQPRVKIWLIARFGRSCFTMFYSILSLILLGWLIMAAGRAPFVELWSWVPWQSYLTISVMLVACLILAMSIARPNPFSFGGAENHNFDPAHPGIVRWIRHPLLAALALWAVAHLVSNGDLAHVLLFGSLTAFAILGGRLVDRRARREMGSGWQTLLHRIRQSGMFPRPSSYGRAFGRIILGIGLFLGLVWVHPVLVGVSPFP